MAAGTNPVFETLPYASLVPVMQSCQQERGPGRCREVQLQGPSQERRGRCPGRGEAGGARTALEEVGPQGWDPPRFLRALGLVLSHSWECCSLAGEGRGPSGQERPDLNPCPGTQQLGAPSPVPSFVMLAHLADSLWDTEAQVE